MAFQHTTKVLDCCSLREVGGVCAHEGRVGIFVSGTELSNGCDAMVEEGNELFDGQRTRKRSVGIV
jgi:hypothetical protein